MSITASAQTTSASFAEKASSIPNAVGEKKISMPFGSEGTPIERRIRLAHRLLETGDVQWAEWALNLLDANELSNATEQENLKLTALRKEISDVRRRENAAGGPGSLYDPNHPFVVACNRARASSRKPTAMFT